MQKHDIAAAIDVIMSCAEQTLSQCLGSNEMCPKLLCCNSSNLCAELAC